MPSLSMVVSVALLVLSGACTVRPAGQDERRSAGSGSQPDPSRVSSTALPGGAAATAPGQGAAPQGQPGTAPVERVRRGPPVRVTGVVAGSRSEGGAAYDRVVIQLADSTTGYYVAYTDGPARRCGSGDPVSVRGTARLLVRLQPAQAHDAAGRPLLAQREMAPGLSAIKDIKLICDFEGQVQWVLGVENRLGFRVSELAAPPRLVIDVAHPR